MNKTTITLAESRVLQRALILLEEREGKNLEALFEKISTLTVLEKPEDFVYEVVFTVGHTGEKQMCGLFTNQAAAEESAKKHHLFLNDSVHVFKVRLCDTDADWVENNTTPSPCVYALAHAAHDWDYHCNYCDTSHEGNCPTPP